MQQIVAIGSNLNATVDGRNMGCGLGVYGQTNGTDSNGARVLRAYCGASIPISTCPCAASFGGPYQWRYLVASRRNTCQRTLRNLLRIYGATPYWLSTVSQNLGKRSLNLGAWESLT